MFTSTARGFISASSAAPMAWRLSGVYGSTSTRWSDWRSSVALSTHSAPPLSRSSASGSGARLW
jgi:hypothetical protein